MDTAAQILLIIVSSVLAIFLLVSIIAVVRVIQVLRSLRHIAAQAEKIADSAETVSEFFAKSAGPLALGRFVANIADAVMKRNNPKGK